MDSSVISENKIIAIIRGQINGPNLLRLAESLYAGGIKLIEVAFENDDKQTLRNISDLVNLAEDKMYVGAGTVLSAEQAEKAVKAGAKYIVSPNTESNVIRATKSLGAISIAGAATPTETVNAVRAGADFIKIFPASVLGLEYIKAMKGPFPDVKFIAAAGITADSFGEYLSAGYDAVGISKPFCDIRAIEEGNYDKITNKALEFSNQINNKK